jgi:hypothetical protein
MLKTIKRIDVGSAAIMGGVTTATFGLIAGLFVASFGGLLNNPNSFGNNNNVFGGLGILAVILLPLIYGLLGLIGGAIYAALYNLFSGMVGGIKVELD